MISLSDDYKNIQQQYNELKEKYNKDISSYRNEYNDKLLSMSNKYENDISEKESIINELNQQIQQFQNKQQQQQQLQPPPPPTIITNNLPEPDEPPLLTNDSLKDFASILSLTPNTKRLIEDVGTPFSKTNNNNNHHHIYEPHNPSPLKQQINNNNNSNNEYEKDMLNNRIIELEDENQKLKNQILIMTETVSVFIYFIYLCRNSKSV